MTKSQQTKVHFKGADDDYIIIAESAQAVKEWRADKHGAQGIMDGASNAQLDSEFGTHREEDVVAQILEKGDIVESDVHSKQGDRNISKGPMSGTGAQYSNNHG
ncbi:hypothetical protein H2203_004584 [Taxawa tesnikishii (nom. ined.)]|nr:hypothetical protein H2203_004584 [Dothideales sp. JES 119]